MGNHVKARPRAKPKPKSIKAKINRKMGSKRRTQRMGKELKKGEKGAAASYLTRAQVDFHAGFMFIGSRDREVLMRDFMPSHDPAGCLFVPWLPQRRASWFTAEQHRRHRGWKL